MGTVASPAERGRPLRLLWLIDSLTAGGAESLLAQQARCAEERRARLEVCCLKTLGTNPFEAQLRDSGVPVTHLEARNLRHLAAYRRLEALVARRRPDLIHAHLNDASTWGALLAWRTGVPLVVTLHVFPDTAPALSRGGLRERLMSRLIRRHAAAIVTVSGAVADAWSRQRGLDRRAIEVVHNGVEPERFGASGTAAGERSTRHRLGLPEESPVVLTVSVLRRGKGHEVLLRAAAKVAERAPGTCFLFAGDGPLADRLRRRSHDLGIAGRCHWLGFRDPVPLYALADVVVLPSDRPDAFPTVLLEAMASETPFVASRVGGVPEILDGSGAGVLVPPGDPDALAAAVGELLMDPARRRRMGQRGLRHATAEFSMAAWWRRIEAVYARSLGTGARPEENADLIETTQGPGVPEGEPEVWPTSGRSVSRRPASRRPAKLVVAEPAGRGGMIHYAFQLCRALARTGIDVILATDRRYELDGLRHPFRVERVFDTWDPKPAGQPVSTTRLARLGRKLRRLPRALRYLRQWLELRRFVRRERPDVLLLGDLRFAADLVGLRLLRPHVPRMVDVCHNVRPYALGGSGAGGFRRSRIEASLYRRIYRLFDRVLVHYESNRREFLAAHGLDPRRVGILPLGNFEIFGELAAVAGDGVRKPDDLARELALEPDHRVILLFGSLSRYKGVDDLLEAFVPVQRRFPGARLLVVGFPMHDFDVEAWRRRARRMDVGDAVRLVPRYVESAEVASWMSLAEIAAFPHRAVYQSASLQVARTFGLPVVTSAVGANHELVADGETGLLVPPGDPEALSAALIRLLEDPALGSRLGQRAREDALTAGSWDRVAADCLAGCGLETGRGPATRNEPTGTTPPGGGTAAVPELETISAGEGS